FSMMKADNRMPQTSLKVAYYPTNQVELIGYYFPYFEESPLFQTLDYSTFYDVVDGEIVYWKKQIPSGDDQSSYALRAMWYSSH